VSGELRRAATPDTWRGIALACLLGIGTAGVAAVDAAASIPVPAGARAEGALDGGDPRVEARLLIHPSDALGGSRLRLGVLFDLDPGWHMYWRHPGETGLPTELHWQVGTAEVAPVEWPAPSVFREADGLLTTYGYADQVLLATEVAFPGDGTGARVAQVEIDLLVCETECIPGHLSLSRRLDADAAEPGAPEQAAVRELFARYRARVPRAPEALGLELEALYSQSAIRPGDAFAGALRVSACAEAERASEACDALAEGADPQFVPDGAESLEIRPTGSGPHPSREGALLVAFEGRASADAAAERLQGVLSLRAPSGAPRHVRVDLPLPRAPAGAEVTALGTPWLEPTGGERSRAGLGLLGAAALALLGGLVLNLMPCVLPVLAIKVFGVAELAHRARRELLHHGLAYTAGILMTMLGLAGVVIALRAAGTSVGWGFQFQEPRFVAAISTLLVVFALNLFGVFEVALNASRLAAVERDATGLRRSFFEGLLAVVLATPCSAPFLGTAVGFAFSQSAFATLVIFLAIGLGLAAPYALVTLVPAWGRLIPRAGGWMLQLRAGLGFALLATAVWLLWVMGRSAGADAVVTLLGFLVAVSFAAWVFGIVQAGGRTRLTRPLGLALAVLVLTGLGAMRLEQAVVLRSPEGAGAARSAAFDRGEVSAQLARGRPVFVYFTADWCITCKVNEHGVIESERVQAELARLDVALFKADWTRRDEAIRAELARFGKAGVPMYLVYGPDAPDRPALLPELLTVDRLVDALRAASPARETAFGASDAPERGARGVS
jgi:thiol:disulfide interchange protein DsbD